MALYEFLNYVSTFDEKRILRPKGRGVLLGSFKRRFCFLEVNIPDDIDTEDQRVEFIKRAVEVIAVKTRLRLNSKKLCASAGWAERACGCLWTPGCGWVGRVTRVCVV